MLVTCRATRNYHSKQQVDHIRSGAYFAAVNGFSIQTEALGVKFQRQWVFKHVNQVFHQGEHWAILGANGSGKSTLLQTLYKFQDPTEGKVLWRNNDVELFPQRGGEWIAFMAPYVDLFENLTLVEALSFHFSLCPMLPGISLSELPKRMELVRHQDKAIRQFSSGMKQRVRLALAIFSNTPAVFLDEPCSNLDQQGIELYQQWCHAFLSDRLVLVASNQLAEYSFCRHQLSVEALKMV